MQRILRGYQVDNVGQIARSLREHESCLWQLHTGGGKTVGFSEITNRFYKKQNKRILIAVHREKLLEQTRKTLKDWHKIIAQPITQETKNIYDYPVYVGMVETLCRRLAKNPKFLPEIGLLIIDEAHLGNFRKLHQYIPNAKTIGVTATPISSNIRDPLKNYYQDIVIGPEIDQLIGEDALCQNHTYSVKGIKRNELKIKNGEFDEASTAETFSRLKHVQNTIKTYERLTPGTKALIFNCNIQHNNRMQAAWSERLYKSECIDGTMPKLEVEAKWRWFKKTKGAILNNVGIAVAGFDEPTIQTIVVNLATMSLVKWLQMTGRGGRPIDAQWIIDHASEYDYDVEEKHYFTILDMGGNARADAHGDWNSPHNWKDWFLNPPKPKEMLGAAPVKDCPNCEAIIASQAQKCPFCGYEFPQAIPIYDSQEVEMELVTKNLDVAQMLKRNQGKNDYLTLYQIGYNIGTQIKYKIGKLKMSDKLAYTALEIYQTKAQEWCKQTDRAWDLFHQNMTRDVLFNTLKKECNWVPATQSMELGNVGMKLTF